LPRSSPGRRRAGETDTGDSTGATEQTEGTGKETQGNTDANPVAQASGVSTAGDSERNDPTGATERR